MKKTPGRGVEHGRDGEAREEQRETRPARHPPVRSPQCRRSQWGWVEDNTARKAPAVVDKTAGGTAARNDPAKEHAGPH